MAKRRSGSVAIVRVPSFAGARRRIARGFSAGAKRAYGERMAITAVATAGLWGWLRGKGSTQSLPRIESLGTEGTYGIVAYLAARQMHSRTLEGIALGLLCSAANRMAGKAAEEETRQQAVKGEVEGDL